MEYSKINPHYCGHHSLGKVIKIYLVEKKVSPNNNTKNLEIPITRDKYKSIFTLNVNHF